jgi:hypothetical protein
MISDKVREYVIEVSKRENAGFTDTDINNMIQLAESKEEAFRLGFLLALSKEDENAEVDEIDDLENIND